MIVFSEHEVAVEDQRAEALIDAEIKLETIEIVRAPTQSVQTIIVESDNLVY
jgi:hypothetical protein